MDILKYEVLNPIVGDKSPFFDNKKGLLFFNAKGCKYKYFVECKTITDDNENYYLLLSENKFNKNCKLCQVDNYGRCKIKLKGEFKDFVINETTYRGDIMVEYVESNEYYDTYIIK